MASTRSTESTPYKGDPDRDLDYVPRILDGEDIPRRSSTPRRLTSSQQAYRGRVADEDAQRQVGADILSPAADISEDGRSNIRNGIEKARAALAARAAGEAAVAETVVNEQLSLDQLTPEDVQYQDPGRPF